MKGVGSCVFPSNCVGSDGLLLGEVRFYHSFGMDPSGLLVGSCVFLRFSLDSMFPLHWVPLGQVRFYHNFGMDPGGLLVGSCVFLGFSLDSMFAFQWALLGQVRFYFSFGVGSSWAPVLF